MAKFCGKCGSKLNEQGKCSNCISDDNKFILKKKPWIGVVVIVLAIAIVIGAISIVSICFRKDNPETDDLQLPIVGKFTDKKITDGESAIKAVQEIADDLGLENAADELTVKREDTVGNLTYYRLQQNYKGIPVYGSDFVVIADENGEAKGVTGNTNDIDESISLTPTVTQEQVEASIQAYFGEEAEVSVPKLTEEMLVVYNSNMTKIPVLSYNIVVSVFEESHSIVADARNGNIYKELLLSYYADEVKNESKNMYVYNANKNLVNKGCIFYDLMGNKYYSLVSGFVDSNGNAVTVSENNDIFDLNNNLLGSYDANKGAEAFIYNGVYNNQFLPAKDNDKAVKLLDLAMRTDTFFQILFSRDGYDNQNGKVLLVIDCSFRSSNGSLYGKNAESWGGKAINGTVLSFGYSENISADIVAHEFTHSVERSISNMEYEGESGAIMEGYSDIFGELFEDWENGAGLDGNCDWVHNKNRNIHTPISSHNPSIYMGDYWTSTTNLSDDKGGVHQNSTVISHAAYLMTKSGIGMDELTGEELATLWYNTLFVLPKNCSFNVLRQNMLMVANSLSYTNKQISRIANAFNSVGIFGIENGATAFEEYGENPTIHVYGINMELYDDYTIDIIKVGNDRSENRHITVDDTNPVSLEMSTGTFTITIRDRKDNTKIVTKNIRIVADDDADQTIQFATNFGDGGSVEIPDAATSDERDIVLVLDNSGSMLGTPIQETRKASENFVKTVLQQDASIGIVAFESEARMLSNFSMDEAQLMSALGNLYANGGTNTLAGLTMAGKMLEQSNAKKKIIVLMSDGCPSNSQSELDECAKELRKKGIIIYALGFFDQVGDDNKVAAQSIMETIADDGRHYEVEDVDNLVFFFGDIADQISGQQYIYIRIACPVEVTVEYDGETLCSDANALSTRTNFGTLSFEERTDGERVKILRLKQGTEYDIHIKGTDDGRMNYTIALMDENGEYSDVRKFYNVKITDKTVINTVASESLNTVLEVDEDGDGKLDVQYKAGENSRGEIVKTNHALWIIPSVILILIAMVTLIVLKKKNILIKKG